VARPAVVNIWREVVNDLSSNSEIASKRLALLDVWRKDPWAYLTGKDIPTEEFPNGKPVFWTVDEMDETIPIKSFPEDKTYLKFITTDLWKYRVVMIDKVRQMYVSTICCLNLDWFASFFEEREIFVSRVKEASAIKLINDKIRTVHKRKPKWLQEACPLDDRPKNIITYGSGSTITGVSQNFAVSDARGPTGSLIFVDEAAYQDFFPEIYQAVVPMTARLWAVSTANVGSPGASLFKDLISDGRPGAEEDEEDDIEIAIPQKEVAQ
jgi:hypothetical protein